MKTREDMAEAKELIRIISLYGALPLQQVVAAFPGRAESVRNLVSRFVKQKRLHYQADSGVISESPNRAVADNMISAFWVLLDFLDRVQYHTASDFPAVISFFTEDDAFDIIVVREGQENLISHALSYGDNENASKRLVVVENPEQIPKLHIAHVAGFCTVDSGGKVSYFHIS